MNSPAHTHIITKDRSAKPIHFCLHFHFARVVWLLSRSPASIELDGRSSESDASARSTAKAHHTGANVPAQKQKHGQSHGQKPVLRRKVAAAGAAKPKVPTRVEPAAVKQQQPQTVVNRARGTLHGLSTIKRHGNVRVTPNTDYLAV